MRIPKAIQHLIESFERLPGIGPKTAQRLTFYLLHVPQHELDRFAQAVQHLKINTHVCSLCFNIDETDPCSICSDSTRDNTVICVVEQPLDILALEKNGKYRGLYHVLHGKIDPLNNIGPDEIYIAQLINRAQSSLYSSSDPAKPESREVLKGNSSRQARTIKEIILATNPTMEGEATAMYIARKLKVDPPAGGGKLRITRIGRGLPVGADIEYADSVTLERAMEGRSEY